MEYIARYRQSDGSPQSLIEHLEGVSALAGKFSGKIGLSSFGELMGLLHDFGKYSNSFQSYIKSAGGKVESDDDDYIDADKMRGKIDHSTAGAQYIWGLQGDSPFRQIAAEIMALCIASHHSGLIDCLFPDGTNIFTKRMEKPSEKTHINEVRNKVDEPVQQWINNILGSSAIENEFRCRLSLLAEGVQSHEIRQFMVGFLARFLFSTLIDADRLNSAERKPKLKQEWAPLVDILEAHLKRFRVEKPIDEIRADISSSCKKVAPRAGAWIETVFESTACRRPDVAPRAGAWFKSTPDRCWHGIGRVYIDCTDPC
jgi:CRISPR-associated endonuclease/helicase Cas3